MERMTAAEYRAQIKPDKPSKYHAQPTVIDGIRFDSKAEAEYYTELMLLKRAGQIITLELQPKFVLQDKPKITYIADFDVTWKDGRREIIDIKGVMTKEFKIKQKLFEARYPYLPLTLVRKTSKGCFETI